MLAYGVAAARFWLGKCDFDTQTCLAGMFTKMFINYRAFRFKNKRLLKNLMIADQGGCPSNFPGIGDVSYVKDLMTEQIVSRDFSCSIFGLYSHPIAKIGWVRLVDK